MLIELANNAINLLFPNLCNACDKPLVKGEETICLFCETRLPLTNYHLSSKENPLIDKFIGRLDIEFALSYLFYDKGGNTQQLLRALKYNGKEEVGNYLGFNYGELFKEQNHPITSYDIIIPLPLHPKKQKKRGYNQCDSIAKGLSESIGIPYNNEIVKRNINNITQTGKNRIERWRNVENIFKIDYSTQLLNKSILLIDDIITTGATLEACGREILKIEGTKLSILTIAYTF